MALLDVMRPVEEGRGELSPAAPNSCVFIEGTRLGRRALRGLLCPVVDLPEGTNKYGQGSPDLVLSGSAQPLHAVPRLQLSCFDVHQRIGSGGFGQVSLAEVKGSGTPVAIKEIRDDLNGASMTTEAMLHAQLIHPRIVPVLAVVPSKDNPASISGLVTSYCEGGSLGQWLDLLRSRSSAPNGSSTTQRVLPLSQHPCVIPGASCTISHQDSRSFLVPWRQRLLIAEHMLEALAHIHAVNVCHLDIKPGNVLMRSSLVDSEVQLCDFGLARKVDGAFMPGRYRGTWPYMPPEMAVRTQTRADPALDMWSLGVVLLDLVSDQPVAHMLSSEDIKQALRLQQLYADLEIARTTADSGVRCEPEWLQLVQSCLQYDPALRPTAQRLLEAVRAQRELCDHRERMRCMLANLPLANVVTGRLGVSGLQPHLQPPTPTSPARIQVVRPILGTAPSSTHLNLPDSLGLYGEQPHPQPPTPTGPASIQVVRPILGTAPSSTHLNLPDSLGLYGEQPHPQPPTPTGPASIQVVRPNLGPAPTPTHLNQPGSLGLHGEQSQPQPEGLPAPARVKIVRPNLGPVPCRAQQLNLPDSLELYTARTSATGRQTVTWDVASIRSLGNYVQGVIPNSGSRSPSPDASARSVDHVAVSSSDNHSVSGSQGSSACCPAGLASESNPLGLQ